MYGIRERWPGPRWRAVFEATWPAYRRWYLSEGLDARPSLVTAASALARFMPELLPTWARLSAQTGHDDLTTAMLTQWNLPRFAPAACSQVIALDDAPTLLRNYDYHPDLFEWVSISTEYLQPVIGTGDCLWGLLDGMNGAGLTLSLAFGGDRRCGDGFGIPLVLRYLLEVCTCVEEAREHLRRLPVAMSYNITMLDRTGAFLTAHLRPGHPPEFRARPLAANHRWDDPVDPAHAARFGSVERSDRLARLIAHGAPAEQIAAQLLRAPLHARQYGNGFGTLYTAAYRPADSRLVYRWPGQSWQRRFDSPDDSIDVVLPRT